MMHFYFKSWENARVFKAELEVLGIEHETTSGVNTVDEGYDYLVMVPDHDLGCTVGYFGD